MQPLARSIVGYAYEHGLDTDTLTELIDLARQPSHLDQTTITTLIKGLYPSDPVPSSLICNVVSSLGQGERMPSLPTQNLLLRWIVMVQEVLQDTSILAKLYNAIFNLLDMMSIRYCPFSPLPGFADRL